MDNTKKHQDREDLAGEYRLGDIGQLVLLVVFLLTYLSDSFFFKFSTGLNSHISLFIRVPLGIFLFFTSGYLAKSGLGIIFGEKRKKNCVVKEGVFGLVRHPIYLGSILFYLGLLMMSLSIVSFFVWFVIIIFYNFLADYEEKLLLKKFGAEYEEYKKEVPMWIPRLIKRN